MRNIIEQVKAAVIPKYGLAKEKREFEKYLRSQGWSRKEAAKAVADKYRKGCQ